jgi:hypothetical protein
MSTLHIRVAKSPNKHLKNVVNSEGKKVPFYRLYAAFNPTGPINSTNTLVNTGDLSEGDLQRAIQNAVAQLRAKRFIIES